MSRRGGSRTGHASGSAGYSMPGHSEIAGFSGQGASAFSETTNHGGRWQEPCPHMKVASACRKCSPKPGQAQRAQGAPQPAPKPVPAPETPE